MNAIWTIAGVLRQTKDKHFVLEDDDGHVWLLDFEWLALRLVNEWLGDRISIDGIRLGRNIFAVGQMEDAGDGPSPRPPDIRHPGPRAGVCLPFPVLSKTRRIPD